MVFSLMSLLIKLKNQNKKFYFLQLKAAQLSGFFYFFKKIVTIRSLSLPIIETKTIL